MIGCVQHQHAPGPPPPAPGYAQFTPPPAGAYAPVPLPAAPQPSGEAIGALVCGLLAPSCFVLGFVALFLGARARRLTREAPQRHGGDQLALIGMIVGGIFGIGAVLFLLAYFGLLAAMFFGIWAAGP
jgi:hypothetical protein